MNRRVSPLVFILGLATGNAFGYDQYEAGRAAGMYFAANDMLLQLKYSECGYLVKKHLKSPSESKAYVLAFLDPSDRSDFSEYIDSKEYRTKLAKNKALVNDTIEKLSGETDKKTACGMTAGLIVSTAQTGFDTWQKFVNKYKLQPKP